MATKSKFWRFLKRTAIVFASILGIVLLSLAVTQWRQTRALEARLEPLRSAGKPTSIRELRPEPVAEGDDAYPAVVPLEPKLKEAALLLQQAIAETESEAEYRVAKVEAIGEFVQQNPDLIAQLIDLSKSPHYRFPLDYEVTPTELTDQLISQLGTPRSIARLLDAHAALSLSEGKVDAAARDAMAVYRWSELAGEQPALISGLMGLAMREIALEIAADVLYTEKASPQARQELLDALTDETEVVDAYVATLDSERAFGLSSFNYLSSLATPFLDDRTEYLEVIQTYQEAARRPSGTDVDREDPSASILVSLIEPAIEAGLDTLRRLQAKIRALKILAAWQDQGAAPGTSLEGLGLSSPTTVDPFDGSAMKIKTVDQTIAVYSVGMDQKDDGGQIADGADAGVWPE